MSTGRSVTEVVGLDQRREPATTAGRAERLPRVGADGVLVDLEYLDRLAREVALVRIAEVWLGPRAPADALDRLRAAGLVLGTERSLADMLQAVVGDADQPDLSVGWGEHQLGRVFQRAISGGGEPEI